MKLSRIGTLALLLVIAISSFQNCAPPSNEPRRITPIGILDLNKMLDDIHTLSEADLSCTVDSNCKLVPIGYMACGGPDEYVLASTHNIQYQSILGLAEEYSNLDQLQTPKNAVSICWALAPERTRCERQVCIRETEL